MGLEIEDVETMLQKAMQLDPENPIYQWVYYTELARNYEENKDRLAAYSKLILQESSPIKKTLETKGSLGKYILSMMQHWAQRMLVGEHGKR